MKVGRFVVECHRAGPFGAPVMVRAGVTAADIGAAIRIGRWIYAVGWLRGGRGDG